MKLIIIAVMNIETGIVSFERVLAERTCDAKYKVACIKGKGHLVAYSGHVWHNDGFDGQHAWYCLDGQCLEPVIMA